MKRKHTIIAIVVLVLVIVLQLLFVHPYIALDSLVALGAPLALPDLLGVENLLTGRDWPIDIYTPACRPLHYERAIKSGLTGRDYNIDYNDYNYLSTLRTQSFFYLLIWLFVILELVVWFRAQNTYSKLYLAAIALSVNIWAEILYLSLNYVNAVLSYGIAFVIFLIINKKICTT